MPCNHCLHMKRNLGHPTCPVHATCLCSDEYNLENCEWCKEYFEKRLKDNDRKCIDQLYLWLQWNDSVNLRWKRLDDKVKFYKKVSLNTKEDYDSDSETVNSENSFAGFNKRKRKEEKSVNKRQKNLSKHKPSLRPSSPRSVNKENTHPTRGVVTMSDISSNSDWASSDEDNEKTEPEEVEDLSSWKQIPKNGSVVSDGRGGQILSFIDDEGREHTYTEEIVSFHITNDKRLWKFRIDKLPTKEKDIVDFKTVISALSPPLLKHGLITDYPNLTPHNRIVKCNPAETRFTTTIIHKCLETFTNVGANQRVSFNIEKLYPIFGAVWDDNELGNDFIKTFSDKKLSCRELAEDLSINKLEVNEDLLDEELAARQLAFKVISSLMVAEQSAKFCTINNLWISVARMLAPAALQAFSSWLKTKFKVRRAVLRNFNLNPIFSKLLKSNPLSNSIFDKEALEKLKEYTATRSLHGFQLLKKRRPTFKPQRPFRERNEFKERRDDGKERNFQQRKKERQPRDKRNEGSSQPQMSKGKSQRGRGFFPRR